MGQGKGRMPELANQFAEITDFFLNLGADWPIAAHRDFLHTGMDVVCYCNDVTTLSSIGPVPELGRNEYPPPPSAVICSGVGSD